MKDDRGERGEGLKFEMCKSANKRSGEWSRQN